MPWVLWATGEGPAWTENPHGLSQDPHALIMQALGPGPSLRTFHTLALQGSTLKATLFYT